MNYLSLICLKITLCGSLTFPTFAPIKFTSESFTDNLSEVEQQTASHITTLTIRRITEDLTDKKMEGRGTGQIGADRAAEYLAKEFAKFGLKSLGDNRSFQQKIKFKVENVFASSFLKVGEEKFAYREDFLVVPPLPVVSKETSAEMVFVKYGVVSEKVKRNDLEGLELKGKIAVVLVGSPKDLDSKEWATATYPQTVHNRLREKGVAGIIRIAQNSGAGAFNQGQIYQTRRRVRLADNSSPTAVSLPTIVINQEVASKIFAQAKEDFRTIKNKLENGENVSANLANIATISLQIEGGESFSSNVIGYIEGSDAKLKEQAVVFTAHYDAYGIEPTGTIYPGAADNALGVGKIVAIAEAVSKMKTKPRRSIIFIALTGEEYGLLGAEYWLQNPTWKLENLAANINYDGIGTDVWGMVKRVTDYGFSHSDLSETIKGVTASYQVEIVPDLSPEQGIFFRSDHYAFFKKGIPALYLIGLPAGDREAFGRRAAAFFTNDYHFSTDVVQSDWNWEGARRLTEIGLVSGLRISERDEMPKMSVSSPFNIPRGSEK
jgi:hypothetical protein